MRLEVVFCLFSPEFCERSFSVGFSLNIESDFGVGVYSASLACSQDKTVDRCIKCHLRLLTTRTGNSSSTKINSEMLWQLALRSHLASADF